MQVFYGDDYLKAHADQRECIQKLRNATTLQVLFYRYVHPSN